MKILPDIIDNNFRGNKIALYCFYLITLVTVGRSLVHIFKFDGGAQSIASIPLDSFGGTGAEAMISMFALWGLSQLLIGLFYIIVAFKYKSLIPLMYVGLIIEYFSRWAIPNLYKPMETIEQAPFSVGNYILVPLVIVMLVLSLRTNDS